MTLTPQHLKTVRAIDAQAGKLLKRGGEEALLGGLHDLMRRFKPVLEAAGPGELDRLSGDYPHFGQFAALLSDLAGAIQAGVFDAEIGRK